MARVWSNVLNAGKWIEVDLYDEVGDIITCYECDSELEVVSKNPVKLKVSKRAELELDDDLIGENDSEDNEDWGLSKEDE